MCKFFSSAYSLKWNLDHISKVIMATLLSKFECSGSSWVGGVLFSNFHLSQMNDAIACMWPAWVPCWESDLPLTTWGSAAAFHCEPVGILAQYMVIWLPMVSAASWIEVGAGGVQRKGCSSDLLSFRCEGSPSYFPFHTVTLAPPPVHGPITLPDLNSWQPLQFPVGKPSKP